MWSHERGCRMGDVHRAWIRVIRCNKATQYIDLWTTKTFAVEKKKSSENNSIETESTLLEICGKQSRNHSGSGPLPRWGEVSFQN
jgi:hypothetical protein